jgi:serine/threonine protein kinase
MLITPTTGGEMRIAVGQKLGSGAHGSVHAGRSTHAKHAIKLFPNTPAAKHSFWREQRAHERLQVPGRHIMRPIALHQTPGAEHYAVSMLPLAHTDAFDHFIARPRDEGKTWTQRDLSTLTVHIVHALAHMHKMGVAHRDIKPENIVAVTNAKGELVWQMTDFGVSSVGVHWGADTHVVSSSRCGTMHYWPPEMFPDTPVTPCAEQGGILLEPADMWALGYTLWQIVCGGHRPWSEATLDSASFRKFVRHAACGAEVGEWKQCTPHDAGFATWMKGQGMPDSLHDRGATWELWDFIQQCMRLTPETRITAQDALYHPWCMEGCERNFPSSSIVSAPPVLFPGGPETRVLASAARRTDPGRTRPPDRVHLPPAAGGGTVTTRAQGGGGARPHSPMHAARSKSLTTTP